MKTTKRLDYRILGLVAIVLLVVFWSFQKPPVSSAVNATGTLDTVASAIVSGGPPKDGIPPVDNPKYVSAADATFLSDNDIVFGINRGGLVRAYPQKVLVWHEIVNENIGGEKLSVTYCPLTGSVIGFGGNFNAHNTDFGTSGKLVNSNLVMYDRATDSYWPQILGVAVSGDSKGTKLKEFPVVWTTWGRWKNSYPQTEVLSTDTGFIRGYGADPYGSYVQNDSYYQRGGPLFPTLAQSERFAPKEVFIGIENGADALAVRKDDARAQRVINTKLGEQDIVLIYDEELDDALAFLSGGRSFEYKNGLVMDNGGSVWNVWGESASDRLEFVNSFNVMWFAWYAFYPQTKIHPEN